MNRDLVAALLTTVDDSPPWALCRELLAAYDDMAAMQDYWRSQVEGHAQAAQQLRVKLAEAEDDSARLAGHIVAHPVGPYNEVLRLHDRRQR